MVSRNVINNSFLIISFIYSNKINKNRTVIFIQLRKITKFIILDVSIKIIIIEVNNPMMRYQFF